MFLATSSLTDSMDIQSFIFLFLQDEIEAEKPPPSENALLPRPKIIHLTRKEVRSWLSPLGKKSHNRYLKMTKALAINKFM